MHRDLSGAQQFQLLEKIDLIVKGDQMLELKGLIIAEGCATQKKSRVIKLTLSIRQESTDRNRYEKTLETKERQNL